MDNDLRSVLIDLSGGSLLRLHDSVGKAIGVMEGSVWVTQDGDPRDVFVEVTMRPARNRTGRRPGYRCNRRTRTSNARATARGAE